MELEEVQRAWDIVAGPDEPLEVRIRGGSMRPLLGPGARLWITRVDPGRLRIGEIVVARGAQGVVAHRLVRREGEALILRGDALAGEDAPVSPDQVLGRVIRLERAGRSIDLTSGPARLAGLLVARAPLVPRALARLRPAARQAALAWYASSPGRLLRRRLRGAVELRIAGEVERELYRRWSRALGSPRGLPDPSSTDVLVVALARGDVVGCSGLTAGSSHGTYVRPRWRRLGIGTALLEIALGDARTEVRASIAPEDRATAGLYRAFGFVPVGAAQWRRACSTSAR